MKIFFIDPSMFLPSYNGQFCGALHAVDIDIRLITRRPRPHEVIAVDGYELRQFFYRVSERMNGSIKPIKGLIKGIEHAIDLQRLVKVAERERPDIIHFSWILLPMVDGWFLERLRRIAPLILTVHNTVPFHNEGTSKLMQSGHDALYDRFDHLIPHTETIRQYLLGLGIAESKMTCMPHPVIALPPPQPAAVDRSAGRKEILFFGNIKQYKGADLLVEAALDIATRRQDFRVTIAGPSFISMDELHRQIATAGQDHLFRFVQRYLNDQDIANELAQTDMIVFPYREIDTSGAFATASQCGKPIIASDIGSFSEAPAKGNIRPIRRANKGDLIEAIEQLMSDDEAYGHWQARSQILAGLMYTWQRYSQECIEIYRRLAAERA